MEILKRYLAGEILEKGLPIHPEDSEEVAWPIANADEVIEKIKLWGLAILGGDIYEKTEQGFEPIYENWCSEIQPGEKWEKFVQRSFVETKQYLKSDWLKDELWFVLVVIEKPDASMLAKSYAR